MVVASCKNQNKKATSSSKSTSENIFDEILEHLENGTWDNDEEFLSQIDDLDTLVSSE